MTPPDETNHPEAHNAATKAELMAGGWPEEQAEFLSKFDGVCAGQDASIVVPVALFALENVACRSFTPAALRQSATLFSEAAFRMGQAATETEKQLAGLEQLAEAQGTSPADPTVH
jgi:hypothetical protein